MGMRRSNSIHKITIAALLTAIGIIIPMFSPVRFVVEPASFTLASHVSIFMAMFISPITAIAVTVGTTLGFFMGGFPIVVVLRAASHIVFVVIGALYLRRFSHTEFSAVKMRLFSFFIGIIHALCEVLVVSAFYFGNNMSEAYYQAGFIYTVMGLVGIGGVIHSMVDFEISLFISKILVKVPELSKIFSNIKLQPANAKQSI